MANKSIFKRTKPSPPPATTTNDAGGLAYQRSAKSALAQFAATGTFNSTFYADADSQVDAVVQLANQVPVTFLAKLAIYARQKGHMKDMPAMLLALLAAKDRGLLARVFNRVIDTGKMLRNFVQIVRSGAAGKKGLTSHSMKRILSGWLNTRQPEALFRDSVGNDPSMNDVLHLVHPKPVDDAHRAIFGYIRGRKDVNAEHLPELVRQYEAWKKGEAEDQPNVHFQLLTCKQLSPAQWADIARRASWDTIRRNLNTFARHGVFEQKGMTELLAKTLSSPKEVAKAKVFPYDILATWAVTEGQVPQVVRDAVSTAMDLATQNVPAVDGKVVVCVDVSISMKSPVTGERKGATTAVRCVDVAALEAATVAKRNPGCHVIPFNDKVVNPTRYNGPALAAKSVLENTKELADLMTGSTSCSSPLAWMNANDFNPDLVLMVSDDQSWVDSINWARSNGTSPTPMMAEWAKLKKRCPNAKLVCHDIQPKLTAQAMPSNDVLLIGGFSDEVFGCISRFLGGVSVPSGDHWVAEIESISL